MNTIIEIKDPQMEEQIRNFKKKYSYWNEEKQIIEYNEKIVGESVCGGGECGAGGCSTSCSGSGCGWD